MTTFSFVPRNLWLITALLAALATCAFAAGTGAAYKQYTDPGKRFIFDYPSTMEVLSENPDAVKVFHPSVSFRISVFIEKRKTKSMRTAEEFVAAFRKRLEEEMSNVTVLGQGKLNGLEGSQAFLVVSFRDAKGVQLVQLVQYYVAEERFLQMTISDRPEGFKNLETVIRRVHNSLKVIDANL
jgi:hypothetical protein